MEKEEKNKTENGKKNNKTESKERKVNENTKKGNLNKKEENKSDKSLDRNKDSKVMYKVDSKNTKTNKKKNDKTNDKTDQKANKKNSNKSEDKSNKERNTESISEKDLKKDMFHSYIWYMIIFSIIGLLIETLFCFITTGNIESRKGLILGPLCPIYGFGAVILIIFLNRYRGHKFQLFIYGTILGTIVEYLISFLLEAIYGARFWDYSWTKFNLNGRICLSYSILWGILAILLIDVVKKWIDKLINKIQGRFRKIIDIILTIILVLDIAITVWGVAVYETRAKEKLNGQNYTSNNNIIEKFQNTAFSNENMEKVFPNLRIVDNNGNQILIRDISNQ